MVDLEGLEQDAVAAAGGDRAALDRVLVAARPLVLARCRNFLPNPADAEEACQDSLLQVALHIERFEQRSKFTTWMYRLTTNAAIDCYRKLKRRRSVQIPVPDGAHGGSTPSVVVGARIDVLESIELLDRGVAEAVLMRDMCELDYAEIAEVLGVPLGTVKRRIHDGREQIRRNLYDR